MAKPACTNAYWPICISGTYSLALNTTGLTGSSGFSLYPITVKLEPIGFDANLRLREPHPVVAVVEDQGSLFQYLVRDRIVVVDDASSDRTVEIVEQHIGSEPSAAGDQPSANPQSQHPSIPAS